MSLRPADLQGCCTRASEADATQAVIGLAAGTLDKAGYAAWLQKNSRRKERRGARQKELAREGR